MMPQTFIKTKTNNKKQSNKVARITIAVLLVSSILSVKIFMEPAVEIIQLIFGGWLNNIVTPAVTISDRIIFIENTINRGRLENIYYFSVTTDRNFWNERLSVVVNNFILLPTFKAFEFLNFVFNLEIDLRFENNPISGIYILGVLALVIFGFGVLTFNPAINPAILWIFVGILPITIVVNAQTFKMVSDLLSVAPEYTAWLVNETFVHKNIYIDSNYFLTNDATKGIERFSDLVIPWLVDNGEVESWGPEFGIQNQTEQIRERERHLVMNNLSNDMFPNLYQKHSEDGTILAAINKPIRRVAFWLEMINRVAVGRELIGESWSRLEKKSEYTEMLEPGLVKNIYGSLNPGGFTQKLSNTVGFEGRAPVKRVTYGDDDDFLDFTLPQKNNISGDSVAKAGNIRDRKQIIYRNVVNNATNSVETGNDLRKPDFNKNTNYIFEKTLQNERTFEYNSKEYLKKYIKSKFNRYWPTKPTVQIVGSKKKIFNQEGELNEFYQLVGDSLGRKKKIEIVNNLENDLYLENLALGWKSYENTKDISETRSFSFEYDFWGDQEILGTEEDEDFLDELDLILLSDSRLGLGNYTYKSEDSAPWALSVTKNLINSPQNLNFTHWSELDYVQENSETLNKEKNKVVPNKKGMLASELRNLAGWGGKKNSEYATKHTNKITNIQSRDENLSNLGIENTSIANENCDKGLLLAQSVDFEYREVLDNNELSGGNHYGTDDSNGQNLALGFDERFNYDQWGEYADDLDIQNLWIDHSDFRKQADKIIKKLYGMVDNLLIATPEHKIPTEIKKEKLHYKKSIDIPVSLTVIEVSSKMATKSKNKNTIPVGNYGGVLILNKKIPLSFKKDVNYPDEFIIIIKSRGETLIKAGKYYGVYVLEFLKNLTTNRYADYRYYLKKLYKLKIWVTNRVINYICAENCWVFSWNYTRKNVWSVKRLELLGVSKLKKIKIIDLWLAFSLKIEDNIPLVDFPKFIPNKKINYHRNIIWLDNLKFKKSMFENNVIYYPESYTVNEEVLFNEYKATRNLLNIFKEQSILGRLIGLFDSATNTFFWEYGKDLFMLLEDHNWADHEGVLLNEDLIIKTLLRLRPHQIEYDLEFEYFSNFKNLTFWGMHEILIGGEESLFDIEIIGEYYSYFINQIYLVNFTGAVLESLSSVLSEKIKEIVVAVLYFIINSEEGLYAQSYKLGLSIKTINTTNSAFRRAALLSMEETHKEIKVIDTIKNSPELKSLFTFLGYHAVNNFVFSKYDYVRIWKLQNLLNNLFRPEYFRISLIKTIIEMFMNIPSYGNWYYRSGGLTGEWVGVKKTYTLLFCALDGEGFWVALNKIPTNCSHVNIKNLVFGKKIVKDILYGGLGKNIVNYTDNTIRGGDEFELDLCYLNPYPTKNTESITVFRQQSFYGVMYIEPEKIINEDVNLDIPMQFRIKNYNNSTPWIGKMYRPSLLPEIYISEIWKADKLQKAEKTETTRYFEDFEDSLILKNFKKFKVNSHSRGLKETLISTMLDRYDVTMKTLSKSSYLSWNFYMKNIKGGWTKNSESVVWDKRGVNEVYSIGGLGSSPIDQLTNPGFDRGQLDYKMGMVQPKIATKQLDTSINLLNYFLIRGSNKTRYRQEYGSGLGIYKDLGESVIENMAPLSIKFKNKITTPKTSYIVEDDSVGAEGPITAGGEESYKPKSLRIGVGTLHGSSVEPITKKIFIGDYALTSDWIQIKNYFGEFFNSLLFLDKKIIWKPNPRGVYDAINNIDLYHVAASYDGKTEEKPKVWDYLENNKVNADILALDEKKEILPVSIRTLAKSELKTGEILELVQNKKKNEIPESFSETVQISWCTSAYLNFKNYIKTVLYGIRQKTLLFLFFDKNWLPMDIFSRVGYIFYDKQGMCFNDPYVLYLIDYVFGSYLQKHVILGAGDVNLLQIIFYRPFIEIILNTNNQDFVKSIIQKYTYEANIFTAFEIVEYLFRGLCNSFGDFENLVLRPKFRVWAFNFTTISYFYIKPVSISRVISSLGIENYTCESLTDSTIFNPLTKFELSYIFEKLQKILGSPYSIVYVLDNLIQKERAIACWVVLMVEQLINFIYKDGFDLTTWGWLNSNVQKALVKAINPTKVNDLLGTFSKITDTGGALNSSFLKFWVEKQISYIFFCDMCEMRGAYYFNALDVVVRVLLGRLSGFVSLTSAPKIKLGVLELLGMSYFWNYDTVIPSNCIEIRRLVAVFDQAVYIQRLLIKWFSNKIAQVVCEDSILWFREMPLIYLKDMLIDSKYILYDWLTLSIVAPNIKIFVNVAVIPFYKFAISEVGKDFVEKIIIVGIFSNRCWEFLEAISDILTTNIGRVVFIEKNSSEHSFGLSLFRHLGVSYLYIRYAYAYKNWEELQEYVETIDSIIGNQRVVISIIISWIDWLLHLRLFGWYSKSNYFVCDWGVTTPKLAPVLEWVDLIVSNLLPRFIILLNVLGAKQLFEFTTIYEVKNVWFDINATWQKSWYQVLGGVKDIKYILNESRHISFILILSIFTSLNRIFTLFIWEDFKIIFQGHEYSLSLRWLINMYYCWESFKGGLVSWGLFFIHWLEMYLLVEIRVNMTLLFYGKRKNVAPDITPGGLGEIWLSEKLISDAFFNFKDYVYDLGKISKFFLDIFMGFSEMRLLKLAYTDFFMEYERNHSGWSTPVFWEDELVGVVNRTLLVEEIKTTWSFWEVKIEEIFADRYKESANLDINYIWNLEYMLNSAYEFGYSQIDSNLKYLMMYEGSIEVFQDYFWSGLESFLENRLQLIWLDVCLLFDFLHEFATEGDFEPIKNPMAEFYDEGMEYVDEFFWGEEGISDDLGLRGLMGRIEVGEDPGNEFTTINNLLEIPEEFEKWMYFDSGNLLHDLSGLDSPDLGELSPSFDISIPVKSLWLVGVFYYNPTTGGTIFLDLDGLLAFIKVLYLDRRLLSLSNMYELIEFKLENSYIDSFVFLRLRVHYFIEDLLQFFDIFYFNPKDFWDLTTYYLVFLTTYFGVITPIFIFLFLVYFSKISVYFEKNFRKFTHNDVFIIKFVSLIYNYTLYRFVYLWVSNVFLFLRMSFAVIFILSGLLILTEGLHFFSVLRIIDNDQENTKYMGGLYFLLERDPFIEKHSPNDEIWDEFKYDSKIDDEWSRVHYDRETAEILGGNLRERGTVYDVTGFGKKFDYPNNFELDEEDDVSSQNLSRTLDQIHNRAVDEASYSLKFVEDSELEREFFREFETVGSDVEGSVNWLNRSRSQVKSIESSRFAEEYYENILNAREKQNETSETLDGRRYDILLYNTLDPKWLYDESIIMSQRELKPEAFNHTLVQTYNSAEVNSHSLSEFKSEISAENRIKNLINRNRGDINYNPILDVWDEDPITDMGSEVSKQMFTSYGSLGNMVDVWADAYGEPITQKIRFSDDPGILDTIAFNFATNDDVSQLDFYKNEKLLLENSFDAVKRVRFPGLGNKPIHTITGRDREKWMPLDDSENYAEEEGQTLLEKLDKNDLAMRFLPDNDFDDDAGVEYYFDWLFWDLNNRGGFKELIKNKIFNKNEISLRDTRRRDLKYLKFDGIDRLGIFKDNIWKENKHIDLEFKILNTLNKYRGMNSNAFYSNNENETKAYTFSQHMDTGQLQEFEDEDLELELDFEYQLMKPSNSEETNYGLNPSEDLEEEQEELWGAFENYYDSGLRSKMNQEKIKFKDYKTYEKKKNYGLLYKILEFSEDPNEKKKQEEKYIENKKKHKVWASAIPGGKSFWENETTPLIPNIMNRNIKVIEEFRENPIVFSKSLGSENENSKKNLEMLEFLNRMRELCEIEDKIQGKLVFLDAATLEKRKKLREIILAEKKGGIDFDFKEFSSIWKGEGEYTWRKMLKKSIKLLEDQNTFVKNIYNIWPNKKEEFLEIREINQKLDKKKKELEERMSTELFEGYFYQIPTNVYYNYVEMLQDSKDAEKKKSEFFTKINKRLVGDLLKPKSKPKENYPEDLGISEVVYGKKKEPRVLLKKATLDKLILKRLVGGVESGFSGLKHSLRSNFLGWIDNQKKYRNILNVDNEVGYNRDTKLVGHVHKLNNIAAPEEHTIINGKKYPINLEIKKNIKKKIKTNFSKTLRLFPVPERKKIRVFLKELKLKNFEFLWQRESAFRKTIKQQNRVFKNAESLKTKIVGFAGDTNSDLGFQSDPLSKKITEYIQRYNQDSSAGRETEFNEDTDALSETIFNTVLEDNWKFNNKLMLNFNSIVDQEYEYRIPRVLATLQDAQDLGEGKKLIKKLKKEKLREFKHNFSWDELDPDEEEEDVEEGDLESSIFDPGTNVSSTDTSVNPLIGSPDQANMGYIIKNNMLFASNLENSLDYQAKDIFHTIKNMEDESVEAMAESWRWMQNVRTRWDNLIYSNTPTPRNVDIGKWKHDTDDSALATSDDVEQSLLDDNLVLRMGGFDLNSNYLTLTPDTSIRIYEGLTKNLKKKGWFSNISLRNPWGLDIRGDYEWGSTQAWDLDDRMQSFGDLFSESRYALHGSKKNILLEKVSTENLEFKKNVDPRHKYDGAKKINTQDFLEYNSRNSGSNFGGLELPPHNMQEINREIVRDLSFVNKNANIRDLSLFLKKKKLETASELSQSRYGVTLQLENLTEFGEYERPELAEGDVFRIMDPYTLTDWGSDVKFDSGTKRFNFLQRSLKQKTVEREYFLKNRQMGTHVVNNKDALDFLWVLKKKKKRLRLGKILGNIRGHNLDTLNSAKLINTGWDSKIESPTVNYGVSFENYGNFGYDKEEEAFSSSEFDDIWVSNRLNELLGRTIEEDSGYDMYDTILDSDKKDFKGFQRFIDRRHKGGGKDKGYKTKINRGVNISEIGGGVGDIDVGKLGDSMSLYKKAGYLSSNLKMKIGYDKNRASGDLSNFLENNILETNKALNYRQRRGKELALLQRGLSLSGYTDSNIADSRAKAKEGVVINLATEKLSSVLKELYLLNQGLVESEKEDDYYVEDTEDFDDLDDNDEGNEPVGEEEVKDSEIFLGEFGFGGDYSPEKNIYINMQKSAGGFHEDSWELDDNNESLEEFDSDFEYDAMLDFLDGLDSSIHFELTNNVPKITMGGHIGSTSQRLSLNLKAPLDNKIGNDPTKINLLSGYNTEELLELDNYDTFDFDNSEIAGLRVSGPDNLRLGTFSISDGVKGELDSSENFSDRFGDFRFEGNDIDDLEDEGVDSLSDDSDGDLGVDIGTIDSDIDGDEDDDEYDEDDESDEDGELGFNEALTDDYVESLKDNAELETTTIFQNYGEIGIDEPDLKQIHTITTSNLIIDGNGESGTDYSLDNQFRDFSKAYTNDDMFQLTVDKRSLGGSQQKAIFRAKNTLKGVYSLGGLNKKLTTMGGKQNIIEEPEIATLDHYTLWGDLKLQKSELEDYFDSGSSVVGGTEIGSDFIFKKIKKIGAIQPNTLEIAQERRLGDPDSWYRDVDSEQQQLESYDEFDFAKTGELSTDGDMTTLQSDILELSKKRPGFFGLYNFNTVNTITDPVEKVDYRFGNQRFKFFPTEIKTNLLDEASGTEPSLSRYDLTFEKKYGLSREFSENIIIENVEGAEDGHETKKIDGFFFDSDDDDFSEYDTSYLEKIALPVSKGFMKKFSNKGGVDYILGADLGNRVEHFEELSAGFSENRTRERKFKRLRKKLNRLLTNSGMRVRSKRKRAGRDGIKNYNYYDTLTPSPYIRSLSVDSNLFSKINSLRVFGAGRLDDYIYRPKLENLIKNNDYDDTDAEELDEFDEFIEEIEEDDSYESDEGMWDFVDDDEVEIEEDDDDGEEYAGEDDGIFLKINKNRGKYLIDNLKKSKAGEYVILEDDGEDSEEDYDSAEFSVEDIDNNSNMLDDRVHASGKLDQNKSARYLLLWEDNEPREYGIKLPPEKTKTARNVEIGEILGGESDLDLNIFGIKTSTVMDAFEDFTEDDDEIGAQSEFDDEFEDEDDDEDEDDLEDTDDDGIDEDEVYDPNSEDPDDSEELEEDSVSRDEWLLELYEDLIENKKRSQKRVIKLTNDQIVKIDDQLTNSYYADLREKQRIVEVSESMQLALESAIASGNIYESLGSSGTVFDIKDQIYGFGDHDSVSLDSEEMEDEYFSNSFSGDDYDDFEEDEDEFENDDEEDEYNDDSEDSITAEALEELDEVLTENFGIISPIENLIEKTSTDFERKYGETMLSLDSLDERMSTLGAPSGWKNKKNKHINFLGGGYHGPSKHDPEIVGVFNVTKKIDTATMRNRYLDQKLQEWGLESSAHDDDIEDYEDMDSGEYIEGFFFDGGNYSDDDLEDPILLKKLQNSDRVDRRGLLNEFSDYFLSHIDESIVIDNLTHSNFGTNLLHLRSKNLNLEKINKFSAIPETKLLLNLNNGNGGKKDWDLVQIRQKSPIELSRVQKFKQPLKHIKSDFILSKNTLALGDILGAENIKTLYRRGNSRDGAIKPRIRWKKLKKKYIKRVDVLENYNTKLKNSALGVTLGQDTPKNKIKKNKTIHHDYIVSNLLENDIKNAANIRIFPNSDNVIRRKTANAVEQNLNFKSKKREKKKWTGLEKAWNFERIDSNLNNSLSLLKLGSVLEGGFINTPLVSTAQGVGEIDEPILNISDSGIYTPVNEERGGKHNFFSDDISTGGRDVEIDDVFSDMEEFLETDSEVNDFEGDEEDVLEDFEDIDEVLEEEEFGYSRLRNNMVKLMNSKKSESIIPTEVLSAFISKLPELDITTTLAEEYKSPLKYPLEKKFLISGYSEQKNLEDISHKKKLKKINYSFKKLNAPNMHRKSHIVDQFSIYHKNLIRPGMELGNSWSRFNIEPFNGFTTKKILLDRGVEYGLGSNVYKNHAVGRRLDELQIRTFGPEIRLDSTVFGYGRLDKASDQNTNSEEDFGVFSGLGYPELVEQHVYDETDWAEMAYGGSIFSNKFTDFIWTVDKLVGDDPEDRETEENQRMDRLLFTSVDDEDGGYGANSLYKTIHILGQVFNLNDYKTVYGLPAGYNRFFSTNNQYLTDIIKGGLKLATEEGWNDILENEDNPDLKKLISEKLYKDASGTDIGPLGFEEGESLYDNRLLNRGWFPEKVIWDFGLRSTTKVGSDPTTLELLADYRHSFSHEFENFGKTPERQAFRSLDWADNPLFNAIDDVIEGIGIEEDIPYSPAHSEKMWHYFEHESRPNSDKLEERALGHLTIKEKYEFEEEDYSEFGPDSDPTDIPGLEGGNFNLLGLNDLIMGNRTWANLKYLGGLNHSEVGGTSLSLADNELYDGIKTDFHNFLLEKLPADPIQGVKQRVLPPTVEGLFGGIDTYDSKIPGFSENITMYENQKQEGEEYIPEIETQRLHKKFQMVERFRPKDEFSLAPTTVGQQNFETEWVVDGEGWMGNTGSNKPVLSFENLPISYIDPISQIFTQPRGVHAVKVSDDLDVFGGIDSPYYSLGDFTNNRIVRGRDNDTAGFPIVSSWSMSAVPDLDNMLYIDEWFYDDKHMTNSPIDSADFIVFPETATTQRDLWWRAVEGGFLGNSAKKELGVSIVTDPTEQYRDFLLSYDYKLFGKSWLNPQNTEIPLKSYSFYNDSEINNWFALRDDLGGSSTGFSSNYENQLYGDYTYGLFLSSNANFEDSLEFYSVRIRDYLYYILSIGIFYVGTVYLPIYDVGLTVFENIVAFFFFKFEVIIFFLKSYILINTHLSISIYIIYPIIGFFQYFYNLVVLVYLNLQLFQSFAVGLNDNSTISNNILLEFFSLLFINWNTVFETSVFEYVFEVIIKKYLPLVLSLLWLYVIIFFAILII